MKTSPWLIHSVFRHNLWAKKKKNVHRQGASNIDCKADVFVCFSIFDVFRFSYPASSTKYDEC